MSDYRQSLRTMLQSLAALEADATPSQAAELEFALRDCRLELLWHGTCKLSNEQLHRLQQVEYRLQMAVSGHGLADGIAPEANRALESFGWTVHT